MHQPGIQIHRVASLVVIGLLSAVSVVFSQEVVSLSFSGGTMDFVWVTVDAPGGMKRVEIGDFSGKHPKEKKRSESIYAPFERNGKRGYYLGKTEVTEEQWATVMGEDNTRSKQPVAGKANSEVQLFLDKLNSMVRESGGIPRTPDGAEGLLKLPTEAEWEYAARGAEGPRYTEQDPYVGDLERYEVFFLPSSEGKAKEVASLPPNPLGLHDMLGNVRELMQENYSVGGTSGGGFLLKGGSYLSERGELRSSARTEHQRLAKDGKPSRRPDAGLRLCLSAEIFTSLASTLPEVKDEEKSSTSPRDERATNPFPEDPRATREKEMRDTFAQFLLNVNSSEEETTSQSSGEVGSTEVALPLEDEPPDPPGRDSTGFRKAAERGDADAQSNLGASYANGNGVPQNYALAVKWYRKAAKQGLAMAQKNLGVCYFNGQGVRRDFVEAYKWYSVAAANGEGSKAAMYRDDAGRYLTPSQLARAQAEAAQMFEQLRRSR